MTKRLGCNWIVLPLILLVSASPVAANEVLLIHDKAFWAEYLQQMTKAASSKLGIDVGQSPYSPPERYKAFIQSAVAGGDVPPMFSWWTGAMFGELVESGALAELDSLWDELLASGEYTSDIRALYKVGEHTYGVPLYVSRWIALYNKAHFASAGIEVPKTWEELIEAAETLKKAGYTPFLATTEGGWRGFIWFQEIMLRTNPNAYTGLHTGEIAYDSDAVRTAFTIWADWYQRGFFSDPRSTEEVADFVRGRGSIYLIGDWAIGLVETAGLTADEDFGAFLIPNMKSDMQSTVISEAGPIVVSRDGAKDPVVMQFLRYFLSVEGANMWGKVSGNWIGNRNAAPPNKLLAEIDSQIAENDTVAFQRWWEAVPSEIQGELVAELNRFMLEPSEDTAERVMRNMQSLNAAYWIDQ